MYTCPLYNTGKYRVAAIFPEHFQSLTVACGPSWPPAWRSSSQGTPAQAHEDLDAEAENFQGNWEERRCQSTWDANLMLWGEVSLCQNTHRQGRGPRTGSRRTPWRCRRRRSGLTAHLTLAFRTILCGASLSYRPVQSLTTKSRAWSRRWKRWWGPLTGTLRQRPARG